MGEEGNEMEGKNLDFWKRKKKGNCVVLGGLHGDLGRKL